MSRLISDSQSDNMGVDFKIVNGGTIVELIEGVMAAEGLEREANVLIEEWRSR